MDTDVLAVDGTTCAVLARHDLFGHYPDRTGVPVWW